MRGWLRQPRDRTWDEAGGVRSVIPLAPGRGFEPRYSEPKSDVLPDWTIRDCNRKQCTRALAAYPETRATDDARHRQQATIPIGNGLLPTNPSHHFRSACGARRVAWL